MTGPTSHTYRSLLTWKRRPEDDSGAGTYHRDHAVSVGDTKKLTMSAAPEYKGDPDLLNPEELFVAALSSCQLLTYLNLADRAGLRVIAYTDDAVGTLEATPHPGSGRRVMRLARVTLRPRISIAAGGDAAKAETLVEEAHRFCFIANSVSSQVVIEAEVAVV